MLVFRCAGKRHVFSFQNVELGMLTCLYSQLHVCACVCVRAHASVHTCVCMHMHAHAHTCVTEFSQHQSMVHERKMQWSDLEFPSRSYIPNPILLLEILP